MPKLIMFMNKSLLYGVACIGVLPPSTADDCPRALVRFCRQIVSKEAIPKPVSSTYLIESNFPEGDSKRTSLFRLKWQHFCLNTACSWLWSP